MEEEWARGGGRGLEVKEGWGLEVEKGWGLEVKEGWGLEVEKEWGLEVEEGWGLEVEKGWFIPRSGLHWCTLLLDHYAEIMYECTNSLLPSPDEIYIYST